MSFRRNLPGAESSTVNIPGVRRWLGGVYLTSSGISGLDDAFGGGIPVKSLILLKHDEPTSNYLTLLRAFVAEGIARGHCVVTCSPTNLIANDTLPLVVGKSSRTESKSAKSQQFKISWRYNSLQKQSNTSPVTPLNFNLSKPMASEMLNQNSPFDIALRCFSRFPSATDEYYDDLLSSIAKQLKSKRCDGDSPFNIGRIALESIISPYLGYDPAASLRPLVRFLHQLRRLARSTFSVFMVAMPVQILGANDISRFEHLFDYVLNLHSFTGRSSVYGEYDGMIRMDKLAVSHLKTNRPESNEFLFKVKKSEVVIERPSLPVDESAQEEPAPSSTPCSGGALPKTLDF